MFSTPKKLLLTVFALTISTGSFADDVTIDFEEFSNADNVTLIDYGFGQANLDVTANGNDLNQGWIYDTNLASNGDPDLSANFNSVTGGLNNYNPGNILVIQEQDNDIMRTDDNASGGVFEFTFSTAVNLQSIDLFDASEGNVIIEMFDAANIKLATFINAFEADTIDTVTPNLYGTMDFNNVMNVSLMTVTLNGVSGGIDNIVISRVSAPSTLAFMLAGLGIFGFMLKRKTK